MKRNASQGSLEVFREAPRSRKGGAAVFIGPDGSERRAAQATIQVPDAPPPLQGEHPDGKILMKRLPGSTPCKLS